MRGERVRCAAGYGRRRQACGSRTLAVVPSPGSLVSVEVPMAQERVATLVPVTAVRRNSFGASVFVLKPAEQGARGGYRAALRPVTLGPQRGDRIIIAEGLEPGERVATAGAFKLREGALVNDVSRADPAGSSGAGN